MFNFGRKQAEVLEQPIQVPAVLVPVSSRVSAVELGGVALTEYEEVAKAIGFNNPALLKAQLLNFFSENGITVFPYQKVSAYLDALAEMEAKKTGEQRVWRWKPLLATSINKLVSAHRNANGQISSQQYQREVPLPVLMTVQKIAKQFPENVYFYVSDFEARDPDPFLAVTAIGLDWWVIERWDEPAFRM